MVVSVLLSMVAFPTTFSLFKAFQQPITIFEISGYWSYHGEQNAGYHVKEHRKLYQKQVSKVTLHFVWGHISKKQTVEGLIQIYLSRKYFLPSNAKLLQIFLSINISYFSRWGQTTKIALLFQSSKRYSVTCTVHTLLEISEHILVK